MPPDNNQPSPETNFSTPPVPPLNTPVAPLPPTVPPKSHGLLITLLIILVLAILAGLWWWQTQSADEVTLEPDVESVTEQTGGANPVVGNDFTGWQTYTNVAESFEFRYPPTWSKCGQGFILNPAQHGSIASSQTENTVACLTRLDADDPLIPYNFILVNLDEDIIDNPTPESLLSYLEDMVDSRNTQAMGSNELEVKNIEETEYFLRLNCDAGCGGTHYFFEDGRLVQLNSYYKNNSDEDYNGIISTFRFLD